MGIAMRSKFQCFDYGLFNCVFAFMCLLGVFFITDYHLDIEKPKRICSNLGLRGIRNPYQ